MELVMLILMAVQILLLSSSVLTLVLHESREIRISNEDLGDRDEMG